MSALYKRAHSPYWWWMERYNGRRFSKSTKMTNKSMAKKITQQWDMNLMLGDLSFLGLSSNSNQQIRQYVNEYIQFLSNRTNSMKGLKTAQGHLNRFTDAMDEKRIKMLSEVSVKTINQYLDSLDVATKTKKNHLQSISSMMKQAVIEDILKTNPCDLASLPQIVKDKTIHRPLQPIDLEIIFNGACSYELFYAFLYHTGLRANDVASLKYGNIDFKKKSIVSLVRKSRRIHEFPIANALVNMIDANSDKDSPLFPTLYSEKEQNDNLSKPRKYMQTLLLSNGRPKADLHSFRHTFNQSLLDLGMEIEDRQRLLAHASSDTTKIYTHPNFDLALQYVNKIPMYGN
ncbi:MAG: site-specific integrase [Candidatus Marinimicrobia bacterium]|jgi:integrase|nr:site-specific integrase [Candidatus Neomarinimicrobiota bacterium]MBT7270500.1 site-specific integrase [Candidatus Neomarinimicrobiota bacterium]|tara:strand:- start:52 stop:1086 length:1035 start_codon:yes stop_codon:yes gene_type:complete